MVAEYGEGPEWRLQNGEPGNDIEPGQRRPGDPIRAGVVAQQNDQVGAERVRRLDDSGHPVEGHVRRADMAGGARRDREREVARPGRRREGVTLHAQAKTGLDGEGVAAKPRERGGRAGDRLENGSATRQAHDPIQSIRASSFSIQKPP
jgi:hypothetical protein